MMNIILLLIMTIFVVSSDSFWNLWVSLELYSFLLTPWLMEGESKSSKVYIFLYFLTQFLASMMFLIGSLSYLSKLCTIILFSSLLLKVSCFPFHSWFISILPHISWEKILVLTSLSKMVPLSMLMLFTPPQDFIWILILGLALPLGGFATPCLRSIVAYSSVAHSSWLVLCTCLSKITSILYIACYLAVSLPLCLLFMMESLTEMKSALAAKTQQACIVILILALSGIPPFLGFIPKLLVIQHLVINGALTEASVLGVLSVLPVYFYFKTGALSLAMKYFLEFAFSNSLSMTVTCAVSLSVLALICLMLKLSLSNSKH